VTKPDNEQQGIRTLNKAKDALEMAEILEPEIRKAQRQAPTPPAQKRSTLPPQENTDSAPVAKKAKPSAEPAAAATSEDKAAVAFVPAEAPTAPVGANTLNKPVARSGADFGDPRSIIGKRVAKQFDDGLYFGSIEEYLPAGTVDKFDNEFWSIEYDDDDQEDAPKEDILEMLKLYERHKHLDKGPPARTSV